MTDTVQVPREATEEMIDAGWKHVTAALCAGKYGHLHDLYRAMLAAAPQATDPRDADRRLLDDAATALTATEERALAAESRLATLTADRDAARATTSILEAVRAALAPFAGCVFNDNGEITVQNQHEIKASAFKSAYFALRALASAPQPAHDATDWKARYGGLVDDALRWKDMYLAVAKERDALAAAQAEIEKLRAERDAALDRALDCEVSIAGHEAMSAKWSAEAHSAALAEIEKLRELASRTHDHLHELTAIIPYNDVAYRLTTDLMASIRALTTQPSKTETRDDG